MSRLRDSDDPAAIRGLSIVAIGLLAGLLAGGRYYPNTGLRPLHFHLLGVAPLLIVPTCFIPGRRNWPRGVAAILLVTGLEASIAIPAALAALHAAQTPDIWQIP